MRSLFSALFAAVFGSDMEADPTGGPSRPEPLRRATLMVNARFMVAVSLAGMMGALYLLTKGALLPFILGLSGVSGGMIALALHSRGNFERAAAVQVYVIMFAGLMLSLADPAVADFGLAVALLGPVHASLLTRSPVKKRTWLLLLVVVAAGALGSVGMFHWPQALATNGEISGGISFGLIGLMVAYTANRLNSAFDVYERGQITAYKHLIEHVQDAVMRFSGDGSVLFVSRSAEKLFGCPRYELNNAGLTDRIHVLDRPIFLTAFAEANRDGKTRTVEVRARRDEPDMQGLPPTFIWVEAALSPVIDPERPADRSEVVLLLRDVTARHDQDSEMREARRLAEEASKAKSQFLATIGHELRTPLNAIVGFSEMMTSGVVGELSPAHAEYAKIIHQSGHHLLGVVQTLLDMSRIDAGKFELQTEAFEPHALIDPSFRMVDQLARERHIRLMTDLPRMLPMVVADERACRQILINLLSNAIKFSHEKGAVVVSMKRQGANLNISVSDRGIGMGEDAIQRLGEPFYQANDGLNRRYEGTGLGLSIVKGLVDLHEGSLHAVSTLGEGTTITVLLPLNGPATKIEETAEITPLHRDSVVQQMPRWQDEKRRAQ